MKFSIGPLFWVIFSILFLFVASSFIVCNIENYSEIELPKVIGPECIAFDCHGNGPYVSVSDGRILKWQGPKLGWTEFAITSPNRQRSLCDGSSNTNLEPICGRPLGLKFNPRDCNLYIADAYFGLLMVGQNGGVAKQLATSAEGVPFKFTNALDIDSQTGMIYFTDSSTRFQRREWLQSIIAGDKTGRLMQYEPNTKKVSVLLKGLAFANGVALNKDNFFLLVAETSNNRILKFWLKGPKVQTSEPFAHLRRPPDNIKRNKNGEFWIALNSERIFQTNLMGHEILQDQVIDKMAWWGKDPVASKLDEEGNVVQVLDGNGGATLNSISDVEEHNGILWIGSSVKPYVGLIKV